MKVKISRLSLVLGLLLLSPAALAESTVPTVARPTTQAAAQTAETIDRIELNLSRRQVTLFQDEQVYQTFPVAVGRPGWETPVGTFEIRSRVVNPAWKHPFEGYIVPGGDPNNPLGQRWMGFWTDGDNWVGFHGTSDSMRASIGTAASHGCVRMLDEDIKVMFELVALGTPVEVIP